MPSPNLTDLLSLYLLLALLVWLKSPSPSIAKIPLFMTAEKLLDERGKALEGLLAEAVRNGGPPT